jgi:all-trans-8'-apo-beta-carotenal 15,15'-oxygenase
MVASFTFNDLGVFYRNRYVRTGEFEQEERAGKTLYRGFGSNLPGGIAANAFRTHFKNAANTGVALHAGRLLALWEGGVPHELDPITLETRGPYTFEGKLLARRSLEAFCIGRQLPFSAHPKVDSSTGELFNFGLRMGATPRLFVYRVAPDGRMDTPRSLALDALWFVHDFTLTARHCVFLLCPTAFDTAAMLLGARAPVDSLAGDAGRSVRVVLVPRDPRGEVVVVDGDAALSCFAFHIANGFQADAHTFVLDAARTDAFPSIPSPRPVAKPAALAPPTLVRFVVDVDARSIRAEARSSCLIELPEVAPCARGREHRFVWGLGAPRQDGPPSLTSLVRLDRRTGAERWVDFGAGLPSGPVFVPRPSGSAEDDGWLLLQVYSPEAHATDLVAVDAASLRVVARARLPHVLPPAFHWAWREGPAT